MSTAITKVCQVCTPILPPIGPQSKILEPPLGIAYAFYSKQYNQHAVNVT